MRTAGEQWMAHVAKKLDAAGTHFAFLGGAVLPILLDDAPVARVRPTKDVDVIVEVVTHLEFSKLEERLRAVGFDHDMTQGAPKCRWQLDGITVDIMPASDNVSEWSSKWFPEALAEAVPVELSADCVSRVITAPFFIATKFDAFCDRGKRDFYGSHDLEDIVTVLDGRTPVWNEIQNSPAALKAFLAESFAELLLEDDFLECVAGHLPPDTASQERVPALLTAMRRVAQSG